MVWNWIFGKKMMIQKNKKNQKNQNKMTKNKHQDHLQKLRSHKMYLKFKNKLKAMDLRFINIIFN